MLRGLEGWHLLIVIGVVAVLFGYKRMPDAARSLGRSMRILKAEVAPLRAEPARVQPSAEQPHHTAEHRSQG